MFIGQKNYDCRVNSNVHLLLIAQNSPEELASACQQLISLLETHNIAALAKTSQETFRAENKHRLALIAATEDELKSLVETVIDKDLHAVCRQKYWGVPGKVYCANQTKNGDLAFLFPGQGSQYVNMAGQLLMDFGFARDYWESLSENISDDINTTIFPKPALMTREQGVQQQQLSQTQTAQPAPGARPLIMGAERIFHDSEEIKAVHGSLYPEDIRNPAFSKGVVRLGKHDEDVKIFRFSPLGCEFRVSDCAPYKDGYSGANRFFATFGAH